MSDSMGFTPGKAFVFEVVANGEAPVRMSPGVERRSSELGALFDSGSTIVEPVTSVEVAADAQIQGAVHEWHSTEHA